MSERAEAAELPGHARETHAHDPGVPPATYLALTDSQRAAVAWLRDEVQRLGEVPLPGTGRTTDRWRVLVELGRLDLARARLAEGHLDALAILNDLGFVSAGSELTWGVWTAEPERVRAERHPNGWRLVGEKRWCSGAGEIDRAVVSATGRDGARLFVIDPRSLEPVDGSWPSIGMEATASMTMRFDVVIGSDAELGEPGAYVERPGFWHGGAGVAAVWFGGAVGVAEHLRMAVTDGASHQLAAAWGRVHTRLEAAGALLARTAKAIDHSPFDGAHARRGAIRVRLAVEDAASVTLAESVGALGAGVLAHDRDYATRVADLQLYLRQLRTETAAGELGALVADEPIRW